MPRTIIRNNPTLTITRSPTDTLSISFAQPTDAPDKDGRTVPGSRIFRIPPGGPFNTNMHWHEEYDEYVRVIRGRVRVFLNGEQIVLGPEHGRFKIPRYAIHAWERADVGKAGEEADDEELVLEESVDPEDGFKTVFFYNIFGILEDGDWRPGPSDQLQLARLMAWVDEYPVLLPDVAPTVAQRVAAHVALALGGFVGWALGYRPWLEEYTPDHLWDVARTRGGSNEGGFTELRRE